MEFLAELREDAAYRIFEYTALLLMSLRRITDGGPLPPVESAVIVLGGRQQPWPPLGQYRTSWPESPFSGVQFRVEAVYQRTVAELLSRDGTLWLVFAPLAVDANVESIAAQARAGDGQPAVDIALQLEGEALAAWLLSLGS